MSLCWGLYRLHREPRHLDRLLEELAPLGPDADPMAWGRLPFLDAVVKEMLRLWPVVTDINRVLDDPELYPDGETFRPERFPERRFGPHEYLPFGGGERMCPGKKVKRMGGMMTPTTGVRLRLDGPRR